MTESVGQHAVEYNKPGKRLEQKLKSGSETKSVSARLADSSDESLVVLIREGSEAAFAELVKRYMRTSYSIAFQLVGDMETAKDLSQDVFVKIYSSVHRLKEGAKYFPWFYRILMNHCMNFSRRKKAIAFIPFSAYFSSDESGQQEFPFEQDSHDEVSDRERIVGSAIDTLSAKQKKVLVLCDIEGFPQEEAAGILGVAVGTVRSRLHYARRELKEKLKQYYNEI
jgi:RNA polymerase sigma-70 factor (ECF subfamily)